MIGAAAIVRFWTRIYCARVVGRWNEEKRERDDWEESLNR